MPIRAASLWLGLPVSNGDSSRGKICGGHVHEYDVRALALGARLFHQHFRNALGDFALLVDRASLKPRDMHVWHFSIPLKVPQIGLRHESSAKNRGWKPRGEMKCDLSPMLCLC